MAGVSPRKKKKFRIEGDVGVGVLREGLWMFRSVFFSLQL